MFNVQYLILHVFVKCFTVTVGICIVAKLVAGIVVFDILERLLQWYRLIDTVEKVIVGGIFPINLVRGEQWLLFSLEIDRM